MLKWKAETDQNLKVILSSWKSMQVLSNKLHFLIHVFKNYFLYVVFQFSPVKPYMNFLCQQDMYEELITWKAKLEQQVVEIRSLLSSMQESKQHPASSPQALEQWEDWLESSKLDDVQGNELIPWFDSSNLVNVEQEVVMHDLYTLMPLPSKAGDCPSQTSASARELERFNKEMIKTNK